MRAVEKVRTLEECEANIERCLKSFWELGEEYRYIKDHNLYKKTHSRWADYCKERWALNESTVAGTVRATETRARIAAESQEDLPDSAPSVSYQAQVLSVLPEEEQAPAWKEAVGEAKDRGKKQPTHADVKRVVDRRRRPAPPSAPTTFDQAHEAAKKMRDRADGFASAVEALMSHMAHLEDHEAQGCAYKIAETVNVVLEVLQNHGHMTPEVARGLVPQPEDGRVEVHA